MLSDNSINLAENLALESDKFSKGAYKVTVQNSAIKNLRYSTVNTQGSNPMWAPGLQTGGGQFEAVIERLEDVFNRSPEITIEPVTFWK